MVPKHPTPVTRLRVERLQRLVQEIGRRHAAGEPLRLQHRLLYEKALAEAHRFIARQAAREGASAAAALGLP